MQPGAHRRVKLPQFTLGNALLGSTYHKTWNATGPLSQSCVIRYPLVVRVFVTLTHGLRHLSRLQSCGQSTRTDQSLLLIFEVIFTISS